MTIPFLDLKSPYIELKEQLDAAYRRVMESGWYILGKEVEAFETEFAAYCQTRHCIGVANGLDPKVLSDIIGKSSGRNWATELYNPWPGVMENVPAAKHYAGGFGVDLMLKDLGLAAEAAMGARAVIPLGELARNLYALHSSQGSGKLDFSSIVNLIKRDAP